MHYDTYRREELRAAICIYTDAIASIKERRLLLDVEEIEATEVISRALGSDCPAKMHDCFSNKNIPS